MLELSGCGNLTELTAVRPWLHCVAYCLEGCSLKALPDLSKYFPALQKLDLSGSGSLMELTCREPLASLQELYLSGCSSLNAVPDLHSFPRLDVEKFTSHPPGE